MSPEAGVVPGSVVKFEGGRPPRGLLVKLLRFALFCAVVGGVAGAAVVAGIFVYYAKDLPEFDDVSQYRPKLATKVYSVDGRLIGEFYEERRVVVPYERIPKRLVQAFIAAEDKKFFDHHGIDYVGMVNAVLQKIKHPANKLRGASTLTQQLAKSLLISSEGFGAATERSLRRKVREALLALRLEEDLNKEEIMWLYLNQVYLGHGGYGVQASAENYFKKNVDELNLAEMALLAGLPQAPSKFSPIVKPTAARARQEYVLKRMAEDGYITQAERQEALALSVEKTVKPRDDRFLDTAPYFAEHVRRYLVETYGNKALLTQGLTVWTTLDLEREGYAETALTDGVREVDRRQGYLGPVVDGALLKDPKKVEAALQAIDKAMLSPHGAAGKGAGSLVEGDSVLVVVTGVDVEHQWATVRAGTKHKGILPLAGMRWARKPKHTENWEFHKVDSVKEVVKVGDVVLAQPWFSKKSFLQNAMGANESAQKLPDEAEVSATSPWFTLDQAPRVQGALISMNPATGYVEAMIGGYSFEESEFNRAFQSCRQPGSAFKPIVYSAAIVREDFTPATMILDTPITLRDDAIGKSWKPQNFEGQFKGEVTCREALMNSMNMPALHVMLTVGTKNVVEWAKHLGIQTPLKEELGTALGSSCVTPWELTSVYTMFARQGLRPEPVFIKRIVDRDGNVLEQHASPNDPWQTHEQKLSALYRFLEEKPQRLMEPDDAYLIHWLLTQVATRGTAARAASLHHPVAGKTGTTNDSFDTWFAGYTPTLVTTVWVGYDNYDHPLAVGEQGGRTSLPIWLEFMGKSLAGKDDGDWHEPPGICNARVDGRTGHRVFEDIPGSFIAPFKCGEEPERAPLAGGETLNEAITSGGI
jgi:penicillin-binding protein 1A